MNNEQLRDILPPVPLPEEPNYMLFAGVAILCLLVSLFLFWFFKMRKVTVVYPGAHETALADLMQLRSLMVPDQAAIYAKKLSDILRSYIEKRFQIPTGRQTTKEFFQQLRTKPVEISTQFKEHGESLRVVLDQCDMAKFAKLVPDQHSLEGMEAAVQQFIEATKKDKEGGK